MTPGIHLLHKPVGPTSFSLVQSCIQSVRSGPGQPKPKLCHGGTLDPFAHGLLLILSGTATRLFEHLHSVPKTYVATVRWGIETDNDDHLGRTVSTADASHLTPGKLDEALAGFVGWSDQIPPATSAKRIDGERAYEKAHRGETVVLPPSRVYLHDARWLVHDLPRESQLQITVRGGYYVRSLAHDLGRRLNCGAHLASLWRSHIGPWADPGPDSPGNSGSKPSVIRGRELLSWAPTRLLTDQEVGDLRQKKSILIGQLLPPQWRVPAGFPDPDPPIRGFHQDRFSFLLRADDQRLHATTILHGL